MTRPALVLLASFLPLAAACPPLPDFVTCEEADACESTGTATTGGGGTPTTSDGVNTVTGDNAEDSSSSALDSESGTTDSPAELPVIIERVVMPDYIDVNGLLQVDVIAQNTDAVHMELDNGEAIELTPIRPGEFGGQIQAFTGLDNGKHTVIFTPSHDAIIGESVEADYVIALPPPGYEVLWQAGDPDVEGHVAAIDVLPDGRPVEFGTYYEMGQPRCYLRLREKTGVPVDFVPVLPTSHCNATDLTIDRNTGVMHVLLDRKGGDGLRWWVGEIAGWGKGPKNIGTGEVGDTALALASRPGLVAVCGSTPVATIDERDALAVLLRPNQDAKERPFDYRPSDDPNAKHQFGETIRDCRFAEDTLVLVGEAHGEHDGEPESRDRLTVIEYDADSDDAVWTVAGPGPGVQSRALGVAVDDEGRYHLAGYTCLDNCTPEGEYRIYSSGGQLDWQASLGQLDSEVFGPHAIAWSPAGYAVIALGEMQGQAPVFKVQAVVQGSYEPLWTFTPNDKQGLQFAFSVTIGPHGEVYAGGLGATNHPAFVVIGS